ncbi:Regulator of G-protein signaling 3 isoform 1 [Schistosoma japonicum]|uniref:Regulator of G-protein signaling 3 isoform 1 n=1 Tax=Schistosoma japonicum TaxID=6182 RepID=A0A4Z2DIF4_SCHJA|nr:Regulator of G-protein signaling 3 isoform 1 [Schistosoma japonicum]
MLRNTTDSSSKQQECYTPSILENNTPVNNNMLSITSKTGDICNKDISCQQYFTLNETTYIPSVYEFQQQPILILTNPRRLQTTVTVPSNTPQITQLSKIPSDKQKNSAYSKESDLESMDLGNNLHNNNKEVSDMTKFSIIPLLPNYSTNNTNNLWLLQQSSSTLERNTNPKRHFKRRVANHHYNRRPIYFANAENFNNSCYSLNATSGITSKFRYNSRSAPPSLMSEVGEYEEAKCQQLRSIIPTITAVNEANENSENCVNCKFLNHAEIFLNDGHIVTAGTIEATNKTFSNRSILHDCKINLLTSSECLSSSIENQKLEDALCTTTVTKNNDSGKSNFPIRSRSLFQLRQLDSPSSTESHSKYSTDIISTMDDSLKQLNAPVSSLIFNCEQNHCLHQYASCTENQYNDGINATKNSNNVVKIKRDKCDKPVCAEKYACIRSYSAMRHPNQCNARIFRSPLDVLSPCKGKLRLNIEYQNHLIKLHVIEAKGLRTISGSGCNSFVRINVSPDKDAKFEKTTEIVENSATPYFNKEFLLDLYKLKYCRRIHLAVYAQLNKESECEFLGGMSFGIPSIQNKKHISGWYYLLEEKMFRKKHLKTALDHTINYKNVLCPSHEFQISDVPKTTSVVKTTRDTSASDQDHVWWNYSNTQIPVNVTLINDHASSKHTNRIHSNKNIKITSDNHNMQDHSFEEFHSVSPSANVMIYSQNLPNTVLAYPIGNPTVNSYFPQLSPLISSRPNMSIPSTNKALSNMRIFQFLIQKGSKGYGFTLCGNCPVFVSHVEPGSPAMQCGIQAGDFIVAIDNVNVSRSTSDSVVRMFRICQHPVHITVSRPVLMKPSTSSSCNTHSLSGRSLGNLINKTCFSVLKKSPSESAKLTQPAVVSKFDQAAFSLSPDQHHNCIPLVASSSLTTFPLSSSSCIDYSSTNQSSCLASPNVFHNSDLKICPSIVHCTIRKPSISQSTSLHQTMNERLTKTNLKHQPTDLRLASIIWHNQHNHQRSQYQHRNDLNDVASVRIAGKGNCTKSSKTPSDHQNVRQSDNKCNDSTQEHGVNLPSLSYQIVNNDKMGSNPVYSFFSNENFTNANLCNLSTVKQSNLHELQHSMSMMMTVMITSATTPLSLGYQNKFCTYLEHHGWLNLLETRGWIKVELLLFPDFLLIAQKSHSGYFSVIKDPIYNAKISYINIPPYASGKLICF